MPPLPNVPNVLKVEFAGTDSGGRPWANVTHFQWSGATPSVSMCQGFADQLGTSWATYMAPLQPAATSLETVKVTDLSSSMGASFEASVPTAGTREGAFLPASAAALVSYPGAGPRYRGGHPRQYLLVGVQADLVDEAHWTTDFVTAFEDGWRNEMTVYVGDVIDGTTIDTQCAVSYYTTDYATIPHTRIRKTVPDVYVISSYVGQPQLASQRSRIGRRRS